MEYRIIAWGYLLLGGALMWILLAGNSKKVAIEVVPTAQEDNVINKKSKSEWKQATESA